MSNKPRFYIIIAVVVLFFIIVGIAVASSGGSTKKAGVASITIQADIGVEYVHINNLNQINGEMDVTAASLPFKFNCNKGDTIQFYVSTTGNYVFNAWWIDTTSTFNNGNPLTIKVNNDLSMNAQVKYQAPIIE